MNFERFNQMNIEEEMGNKKKNLLVNKLSEISITKTDSTISLASQSVVDVGLAGLAQGILTGAGLNLTQPESGTNLIKEIERTLQPEDTSETADLPEEENDEAYKEQSEDDETPFDTAEVDLGLDFSKYASAVDKIVDESDLKPLKSFYNEEEQSELEKSSKDLIQPIESPEKSGFQEFLEEGKNVWSNPSDSKSDKVYTEGELKVQLLSQQMELEGLMKVREQNSVAVALSNLLKDFSTHELPGRVARLMLRGVLIERIFNRVNKSSLKRDSIEIVDLIARKGNLENFESFDSYYNFNSLCCSILPRSQGILDTIRSQIRYLNFKETKESSDLRSSSSSVMDFSLYKSVLKDEVAPKKAASETTVSKKPAPIKKQLTTDDSSTPTSSRFGLEDLRNKIPSSRATSVVKKVPVRSTLTDAAIKQWADAAEEESE